MNFRVSYRIFLLGVGKHLGDLLNVSTFIHLNVSLQNHDL